MRITRSRWFRILFVLVCLTATAASGAYMAFYWTILRDLPDLRTVTDYNPPVLSRVLDREGRLIGEFAEQRRILVPFDAIPRHVIHAFVAAEDAAFFEHKGLDYQGILRAAWVNLLGGGIRQGGSTITQQTVKSLLLTPERKFRRKAKEMVLARRLEERFEKNEILYLYLNQIYFGGGAWGIGEAARTYFAKHVSELTISEAALLAGLPQRPSDYSPNANPKAAERRRRYVLQRMREERFINLTQYEEAKAQVPELVPSPHRDDMRVSAYFTEEVRRLLFEQLGGELVLTGGLTIETTLDLDLQHAAVSAVRTGLEDLDKRQGWRGPITEVDPALLYGAVQDAAQWNKIGTVENEDGEEVQAPIPLDRPLQGVVTSVDVEAKKAYIAFGPERGGTASLDDVDWAREPDPSKRARPVKSIDLIFSVGDVALFDVIEVDEASGLARTTLHQRPLAEGALISFEVDTGAVRSLVGGYDYNRSEFDRATQARRQAGSSFKPFVYAAALERGYTPASILVDRPAVYTDPNSGFVWRPENYSRKFLGRLTMREALARSVNNATIHLFQDLRIKTVHELARRLGVESPLTNDLSLALGSSSVTLLEMTRAYGIFAAGGRQVQPYFITSVRDREGRLLLENLSLGPELPSPEDLPRPPPLPEPELSDQELAAVAAPTPKLEPEEVPEDVHHVVWPEVAYLTADMLRATVVDLHGTGRRARELGRPVGGKTGTTNDGGDAWFVGFSPEVATGVWVGYDEKRVLGKGETGGRAALPIWVEYMKAALVEHPRRDFSVPEGISFARIDPESGLLAETSSKQAFFQPFIAGTEPTEAAASSLTASENNRLLRLDSF